MEKSVIGDEVYVIRNFLPADVCAAFIAKSEAMGFEEATVTTSAGQVMMKNIRNNQRVLLTDTALAADFWQRLKPFVDERYGDWKPMGVNEQFRFYKYAVNERFNRHRDGRFRRHAHEESRLTLMVYLNDDFSGGETEFENFTLLPEQGMALVFRHDIKHKGCKVLDGVKYAIRTDIMFSDV